MPYAKEQDSIAQLETKLLDLEDKTDILEDQKRHIENDLRMEVEIRAEDKASGLTNEKKRQLAYEELADCNEELQGIYAELKDLRRTQKRLGIELRNEGRAFQFIIAKGE